MSYPIYLDYSATTPVDPRVIEAMTATLWNVPGNPASRSHPYGWEAEKLVEQAREHVASLIGAESRNIIWTSGATESNNLAIKGVAHFYQKKGKHIVTSKIEHKSVLDSCRQLEREGFEITYLVPTADGLITADMVKEALRPDTILVSLMHVNNELGTINDIASIGKLTSSKGIFFHVDAAQSAGKVLIDVNEMNVNLMSFSAHKIYGPKGIGALFTSRSPRVRIEPMMHGGGHERGLRSGTLPTHQIVGMGEAFRIAKEEMEQDNKKIVRLRDMLWNALKDSIPEIYLNGSMERRVAGNLNVSFNFIEGESLIMAMKGIAVSSGSACTSSSLEPSYVLRALGKSDELAHSSIRFTLGRFTLERQIVDTIKIVTSAVTRLRELSPLWEMHQEGIDLNSVKWLSH